MKIPTDWRILEIIKPAPLVQHYSIEAKFGTNLLSDISFNNIKMGGKKV